jgi:hypothetical protein
MLSQTFIPHSSHYFVRLFNIVRVIDWYDSPFFTWSIWCWSFNANSSVPGKFGRSRCLVLFAQLSLRHWVDSVHFAKSVSRFLFSVRHAGPQIWCHRLGAVYLAALILCCRFGLTHCIPQILQASFPCLPPSLDLLGRWRHFWLWSVGEDYRRTYSRVTRLKQCSMLVGLIEAGMGIMEWQNSCRISRSLWKNSALSFRDSITFAT